MQCTHTRLFTESALSFQRNHCTQGRLLMLKHHVRLKKQTHTHTHTHAHAHARIYAYTQITLPLIFILIKLAFLT